MKILYIHTGRIEENKANCIQTLQMCKAFAKAGHDVILAINTFMLSQKEAEKAVMEELGTDSLPFELRAYRGGSLFGRAKALFCIKPARRLTAEIDCDLIFLRDPLLYPFMCKRHGPVAFETHNRIAFPHGKLFNRFWLWICIKAARSPQTVIFIAISKALGRWWKDKGVPAEKLISLHDAVDPSLFKPDIDANVAREELKLPSQGKLVLYAGSLYKDRCIDNILNIAKARPDHTFVIVGGPEDAMVEYKQQAKDDDINNIIFTGRVPHKQIPDYLAAADILLMLWSRSVPTINYCSPLKLFEYMAAGRTIVGHGFPTIKEVLTDGSTALLSDPDSFLSLSDKLDQALDLTDNSMGAAARKLAEHEFTWAMRCEKIIKRLS